MVKKILENKDFFKEIVVRYEKKLMRYILRLGNFSKESAEDLLQDVFIKIYRHLHSFDPSLKFSSWAYRITHNEVISEFRRSKARPKTVNIDSAEIINFFKSSSDLIRNLKNKELKNSIQVLISEIPQKYQEVLILFFLEEKKYAEISDILRISEGAVATRLNRAKKYFRNLAAQRKII